MKKIKQMCDVCKKEVDDYYSVVGWYHIDKYGFKITNGRNKKGIAKYSFYDSRITAEEDIDFCSKKCFDKWLYDNRNKKNEE